MIPKKLHQCFFPSVNYNTWLTDENERKRLNDKFNNTCKNYCASFVLKNPGFLYYLWNYDNMALVNPANDTEEKALALVRGDLLYTLKSDIWRVLVVYKYGGVYADTDFLCQKDLSPLLNTQSFCARETQDGAFASSFMGSAAGNPVLFECLKMIIKLIEANRETCDKGKWNVLNHGFFLSSLYLMRFETIYPTNFFFPYFCTELDKEEMNFPDSFAVHKWESQKPGGWCQEVDKK